MSNVSDFPFSINRYQIFGFWKLSCSFVQSPLLGGCSHIHLSICFMGDWLDWPIKLNTHPALGHFTNYVLVHCTLKLRLDKCIARVYEWIGVDWFWNLVGIFNILCCVKCKIQYLSAYYIFFLQSPTSVPSSLFMFEYTSHSRIMHAYLKIVGLWHGCMAFLPSQSHCTNLSMFQLIIFSLWFLKIELLLLLDLY